LLVIYTELIYIFFVFGEFLTAGFATGFDCGNLVILMVENGILITQEG